MVTFTVGPFLLTMPLPQPPNTGVHPLHALLATLTLVSKASFLALLSQLPWWCSRVVVLDQALVYVIVGTQPHLFIHPQQRQGCRDRPHGLHSLILNCLVLYKEGLPVSVLECAHLVSWSAHTLNKLSHRKYSFTEAGLRHG